MDMAFDPISPDADMELSLEAEQDQGTSRKEAGAVVKWSQERDRCGGNCGKVRSDKESETGWGSEVAATSLGSEATGSTLKGYGRFIIWLLRERADS